MNSTNACAYNKLARPSRRLPIWDKLPPMLEDILMTYDRNFRTRARANTWNIGAVLLSAFFASACANSAEPSSATRLSPEQLTAANAAQIREPIERLTHRSAAAPEVGSDGTTEVVDLRGGFQSVTMVRKNPDGTHTTICTDSADEAVRFMLSEPTPTAEDR